MAKLQQLEQKIKYEFRIKERFHIVISFTIRKNKKLYKNEMDFGMKW